MRFLLLILITITINAQENSTLTDEIRVEIMQWANPMRVKIELNPKSELLKKNIVRMLDILMLLEQQKEDKKLILLLLKQLQRNGMRELND